MTFQDLHLGQRVRVLSWDELESISTPEPFGLRLPDGTFFHNNMRYLCGCSLAIKAIPYRDYSDENYLSPCIFQFDDPSLTFSDHYPTNDNGFWSLSCHARPSQ